MCGQDYDDFDPVNDDLCNVRCSGDPNFICGGKNFGSSFQRTNIFSFMDSNNIIKLEDTRNSLSTTLWFDLRYSMLEYIPMCRLFWHAWKM